MKGFMQWLVTTPEGRIHLIQIVLNFTVVASLIAYLIQTLHA